MQVALLPQKKPSAHHIFLGVCAYEATSARQPAIAPSLCRHDLVCACWSEMWNRRARVKKEGQGGSWPLPWERMRKRDARSACFKAAALLRLSLVLAPACSLVPATLVRLALRTSLQRAMDTIKGSLDAAKQAMLGVSKDKASLRGAMDEPHSRVGGAAAAALGPTRLRPCCSRHPQPEGTGAPAGAMGAAHKTAEVPQVGEKKVEGSIEWGQKPPATCGGDCGARGGGGGVRRAAAAGSSGA